ncbi:hypothetical protein F4803DRAFT_534927, partial [Xylaria telfairii]
MASHIHLDTEDWPIKASVYTKPIEGDRWESRIICLITPGALCCQDHYKKIGQYENHLMKHHPVEARAARQRWDAMARSGQGVPPFMSLAHQGLVQPSNGAAPVPGAGIPQSHYINSANSVLPSVGNETSVTSPATASMTPASDPPVNGGDTPFVTGPAQTLFMGFGNFGFDPVGNGAITPSPNSLATGWLNSGSPNPMGNPVPVQQRSTSQSQSNRSTATGTGAAGHLPPPLHLLQTSPLLPAHL